MFLVLIAFISGILTVFSPCVLPILPIILASGVDGNTKRVHGVISGLVVSFTAASLLLATVVRVLDISAESVRHLAVGLLGLFGLSLVFPQIWQTVQGWIEKYWHIQPTKTQLSGFSGGFITGVSLGVVWTPCIGPVVATVATLAAIGSFSVSSFSIALAYAFGTAVPLFFIARSGSAVSQKLSFVKTHNQEIRQVFGLVILGTALFIWSGTDRTLQAWTLSHLPETWTQVATSFEKRVVPMSKPTSATPAAESETTPTTVPQTSFTARFEIYTNGTRRIFTDPKYHHQSSEVFIEKLDPHLIMVEKSGITWSDFFETLPFSLKPDCLLTGTGQTFCTNETHQLFFSLNGQETPDALQKEISPNDLLRVEYRKIVQ